MKLVKRLKQPFVLILVVMLLMTTILSTTSIADDLVNLNPYRIVFRGKNLNAFGKVHRDMNIYQAGEGDGAPPVLCIQEGHKIPDCSPAKYEFYEVKPGQTVPVIGPFDRYLAMVLAYEWLMSDNYYIPSRYGVVQVYYWGCMSGYEHNWALQDQAMRKLQVALNGDPNVMMYYEEMKEHILQGESEYNGTSNTSLPVWAGSQQKMALKDGLYELTLDISNCPQLQNAAWSFPDNNWSYQLSQDSKSITFQYNGMQEPSGTVTSAEIQGIEAQYYAYIFTPAASENFQKQLGWLNFEHSMAVVSFSVNSTTTSFPGKSQLELYRHSETFESNYNIDLEKYCAETNQPLEGTTFNVWEDFEFSQVNEDGYTEGEPDGASGEVCLNCMSPEPESDYICDTITTDTNGQASHSDARYYNYSKTYCMGHPAPEWIECDHEEDEECNCDEENDRLREQWMAEQELCAATCDFHVQNGDEDNHGQDPAAMEAMLADRDVTYENFINLEYSYHLQEKTARTGYILHGLHSDDKEIETVILTSAQAGGSVAAGDHGKAAVVRKVLDPVYTTVSRMQGTRAYVYPVPEESDMGLDEQRSVVDITKEKEEKIPIDIPESSSIAGTEPSETGGSGSGTPGPGENGSGSGGTEENGTGSGTSGTGGTISGGQGAGGSGTSGAGGTGENGGGNGISETEENGGGSEIPGIGENGSGSGTPETGENGSGSGENGENGTGSGHQETGASGSGSGTPGTGENGTGNGTPGTGASGSGSETSGTEESGSGSGAAGTGENGSGSGTPGTGESGSGGRTSGTEENGTENGTGTAGIPMASNAMKSSHSRSILFSSRATGSNAVKHREVSDGAVSGAADGAADESTDVQEEVYESYEYIRTPIHPSFEMDINFTERSHEPQEEGNAVTCFLASLLADDGDDDGSITASLPAFMDDNLDAMDVSVYGDPGDILYTFKVWDHRTEGRIHINKRDLELYQDDREGSYGLTQGDSTLEGAVYGLFAAQDIVHPDGKSDIVYNQNDLVSVAATDKRGDASFLAYTERPGTRLDGDGTIKAPDGITGPENLYNGSSVTSSSEGFGTITYPDYVTENENQWIGRPLLMGNYYIMELSRSEGYELSVNGISLAESNRTQGGTAMVREAGRAGISGGLSDYNTMNADGSWNDFTVENYKTENGYDITVTGYPAGTDFYEIKTGTESKVFRVIRGSSLQPKADKDGNSVYQTARGGEYKIDSHGNPIVKPDTATDSGPDGRAPYGEILPYHFRTAPYPSGSASPEDMSRWGQPIDGDYLAGQVNGMLDQIGYKAESDRSPWAEVKLTGSTNAKAAAEIMDWYTAHNFYDCGTVESIYEKEGAYYARLLYDYSATRDVSSADTSPAVYDSVNQKLYVHKTAETDGGPSGKVGYWIEYQKGEYSLSSRTVSVKEKKAITVPVTYGADIGAYIETIYQPVYETYREGEILLSKEGTPIPVLERVYEYEDRTETYDIDVPEPVTPIYDAGTGVYTIHMDNAVDWSGATESVYTTFRAVTPQSSIDYEGMEMPYNQYLTDVAGAGVSAYAAIPAFDAGSYIVSQMLVYPGQNQPAQDGGTGARPVQVQQRAIKQSVKVTKDISQASYDGVNTYGSVHNDPLTVLLGLFNGGNSSQGTKILNQFKFKAYLKSNLENIFVDESGHIISEDIGTEDFEEDVRKIYLPPSDGGGRRLLETKEDGTYDYTKFFDAMYAVGRKRGGVRTDEAVRQFAIDYYDVDAYKKEVLTAEPGLNSDKAYQKALDRAEDEATSYLETFAGLDSRLAISWDNDPGGGADGDPATLQCNTKNGEDDYYNNSIMLPYGTYVIAEQIPADLGKELANRHFNKDYPKEVTLPFVPDICQDANTGELDVNYQTGSPYYRYDSKDTPEDLIKKYKIRFNEESHIIQAHGQDGDFQVYKYGLDRDMRPGRSLTSTEPYEAEYMDGRNMAVKGYYAGYTSQSEDAGTRDGVVYGGYETDDGQMQIRDHVPAMAGMQTAVDGKFAPMLVPWTVLAPAVDRVNPDTGNVETLMPSGSGADFSFAAFSQEDFEDVYYSSRLRIEKLDGETGDNIIHDGALFKIYAAKRDVKKNGTNTAAGTGDVLFGEAVDWEGNPVADADGNKILYPRAGQDNAGTDDLPIRLDREGIPQYEESQLIKQEDQDGNETGIFKAYSTAREVVIDGRVQKVQVGYIETYKPLGAGAYVLVEVQAPEGYTKSRPVAFEVYSDDVTYYRDDRKPDGTTDGWKPETAPQYQYAVPAVGETNKFQTGTVSQIEVRDYPSRVEIHKTEDGDSMAGNQNVLLETDAQGQTELSGGFEGDITVNDAGDLLTYQVHGRKEKLEERGDVRNIAYSPETKDWYGYVTKTFDEYSEHIIEGTEKALKAMAGVKPLYEPDGTFTGRGIQFDIPVSGARLSLYKAVEIEKTGEHTYRGVTAVREDGKVTGITDTNTGTYKEIRMTGRDSGPAALDVWDTVAVDHEPVSLYYYAPDTVDTRKDPFSGELIALDERGNKLCYVDSQTGMAYVYDDYGRMLAYIVDEEGNKELVKSIRVLDDGSGQTIYEDKTTVDDEKGLPIYYSGGNLVTKDESWITDASTDPCGTPEDSNAMHTIARLPFGAYILQEEKVPYGQGYIQAKHMGLVLKDTDEVQKYFMQNEFTKAAFAKIDVRTQREIQGAFMTLYHAQLDGEGNPVMGEGGTYKKGDILANWISGCQYDDNGTPKLDGKGQPVPAAEPHWIDHIPVGFYVLEETICPYEQGYVQSASVNIEVKETGDVQSFEMEDDFTAINISKYDTENGDIIYGDSEAELTLYRAKLDDKGYPVIEDGLPQYDEAGRIFTFRAATYKDGQDVAATGRVVPDAGGNNPIMRYDYDIKVIPNTYQGRYYYTEDGAVRLEYLPMGTYVLAENSNPEGYATADPILITIEDKGHLVEIHQAEMGDKPLSLEVSKVDIAGGREVNGARLSVYKVNDDGNVSEDPLVLHQPVSDGKYQDITAEWTSGLDGRYTEEDQKEGKIPAGLKAGDLKPHLIEYILEGDYILREETAPYGFLQSVDMPFTIADTQILQKVEMIDEIPDGVLKITKSDTDNGEQKLQGVQFRLVNQTTGTACGTVTTDAQGRAQFVAQPIGYMDHEGEFKPYTYVCTETKAASGHMLALQPYEFQFEYRNELTDLIIIEYSPTNDSNRVVTDKLLGDTDEMIEGVTLRIERQADAEWESVEEWVTGKQGHYTRNLKAGKYRLTEVRAAEGFRLLADPIEFTIEDGMAQVPHLTMRNYTSIIDIQKTVSGKDTLLAGARLQLIDKDSGKVIREWTSEPEDGQRFYGLKPGTYIIHELQAPEGYKRAEDQEVVVTEDQEATAAWDQDSGQAPHGTVQVFRFENRTASSSGGGGGSRPRPEVEYIIFKKTDTSGNAVQGAEFTFYDQTGRVIGTSVSDRTGTFRIRKPENGTYTFQETKTPAGYARNTDIFSFTVSGSDIIRGTYEVQDHELEVTITKLDGDSGLPLSGARLKISRIDQEDKEDIYAHEDSNGNMGKTGYEGTTGSDGAFIYQPMAPGRYAIREIEAPRGYEVIDTVNEFTVEEDGKISGDTNVYNWKEKPPARRVGSITAVYKVKNRFGKGTYHFGSGFKDKVRTGDDIPVFAAAATAVFCIVGFAVSLFLRRKEKWTAGKKAMTVILILIPMALVCTFDVLASEMGEMTGALTAGTDTLSVSGQITYPAMEAAEPVPQTAWILARDEVSGKEAKVLLPLTDYRFSGKRWEEGFEMDVTVSGYGMDCYDLGGRLVGPAEGETGIMADGWEEGLLAQAGLDREDYRIDRFQWKGQVYERDGVQCRDLRAIGRRMTADCMAVYGGEVNRSVFTQGAGDGGVEGGKDDAGESIAVSITEDGIMGKGIMGKGIMGGGIGTTGAAHMCLAITAAVLILLAAGVIIRRRTAVLSVRRYAAGAAASLFLMGAVLSVSFLVKAGYAYAGCRQAYDAVQKAAYRQEKPDFGILCPWDSVRADAGGGTGGESDISGDTDGESDISGGTDGESDTTLQTGINEPALLAINPEYRFWISVPGTGIEYPVVQHEDNRYYLNHGFDLEEHITGCIFTDCSAIPLAADNTILYGHNMKDGSMFAGLKKYRRESYLREHPVIKIFYRGRWMDCPVFSCQLRHENDAGAYGTNLMEEEWLPYLVKMRQASLYDTGIIPHGDEKLLTLSTCCGKGKRLIVQALLTGV